MHPLAEDVSLLTEVQLEQKILKLNRAYFIAHDESVRHQILLLLDTYKIEQEQRRIASRKKMEQEGRDDLDNLINIS